MRLARVAFVVWLVASLPLVQVGAVIGCVGGIAGLVAVWRVRGLAKTLDKVIVVQATQIAGALEQVGGTEAATSDE